MPSSDDDRQFNSNFHGLLERLYQSDLFDSTQT